MARASAGQGFARVEGGDDAERLARAGGAVGATRGDGCGLDAREQVIDRAQGVAPAGEAAEGIAAVLRERLQGPFEAGRLGRGGVVRRKFRTRTVLLADMRTWCFSLTNHVKFNEGNQFTEVLSIFTGALVFSQLLSIFG